MTGKAVHRAGNWLLDILMEILEKGGYSHIVLRQALEKYQYLAKAGSGSDYENYRRGY